MQLHDRHFYLPSVFALCLSGSFFVSVSGQDLIDDSLSGDPAPFQKLTPTPAETRNRENLESFAKAFTFHYWDGKATPEDLKALTVLVQKDSSSEFLADFYEAAVQKHGLTDAQITAFCQTAEKEPDDLMLNLTAAELLISRRKTEEALAFQKRAFQIFTKNYQVPLHPKIQQLILTKYLMNSLLLKKQEDVNAASELLLSEPYLSGIPSSAEVLLILAAAQAEAEKPPLPTPWGFLPGKSMELWNKLQLAVNRYLQVRQSDPELFSGKQLITGIILMSGNGDRFMKFLQTEYLETENVVLLPEMADTAVSLRQFMTGVRYWELFFRKNGFAPLPLLLRALDVLHGMKEDEHARDLLMQYGASYGRNPGFLIRKMRILSALQDPEGALAAVQAMPESFNKYYLESVILYEMARFSEAYTAIQKAEKAAIAGKIKYQTPDFLLQYANLAEKCRDVKAVDRILTPFIEKNPDNSLFLNFLGYTLADYNQDLERAEKLIARALKLEPESGAILDSMAWVLYRQGRIAEAKTFILKALEKEKDSEDSVIFDHAGDIFHASGDTVKARTFWEKALTLPGDADKAKIRQKLEKSGRK